MPVIVFFETHLEFGYPFTAYRSPAFRPIGPFRLADLLSSYNPSPQSLSWDKPLPTVPRQGKFGLPIFVNSALIPSRRQVDKLLSHLRSVQDQGEGWVLRSGDQVIALSLNGLSSVPSRTSLKTLAGKKNLLTVTGDYHLLSHLHQWVSVGLALLDTEIEEYIATKGLKRSRRYRNLWQGKGVEIHPSVEIHGGPVAIGEGTRIAAFTCLEGPLVIGSNCQVNPHAYLKQSYIGNITKVGGEVHSSVIGEYSNKAHYGYLGNSYVGEWVNIGAGSVTSNLKNNYRTVNYVDGSGYRRDSGENFLGSLLGDFSKIGINSSLAPGVVIGLGASVSGTISRNVGDFSIFNSSENISGHLKFPSFLETHRKMFARRDFHPGPEYWERLEKLYRESLRKK